jgi:uncharacterized protein (TIGR00730 family)
MEDIKTPHQKRSQALKEFAISTKARVSRIEEEFAQGFELINNYNDTVTFFGSARFTEHHPMYIKARQLARILSDLGYTIVSGGGGGIMEASNRGAYDAGGESLGLNITLPKEQNLNPYTTASRSFRYFFSRKVLLAYGATAYIYFPGGFGTMDEFFEVLTLIQTKKMASAPIILFGNEFWGGLQDFVTEYLLEKTETITPGDETLYTITEDIDIIVKIINQYRDTISALNK